MARPAGLTLIAPKPVTVAVLLPESAIVEVRWSYFVGQSEGDLKVDSDGLQSPRGPA